MKGSVLDLQLPPHVPAVALPVQLHSNLVPKLALLLADVSQRASAVVFQLHDTAVDAPAKTASCATAKSSGSSMAMCLLMPVRGHAPTRRVPYPRTATRREEPL